MINRKSSSSNLFNNFVAEASLINLDFFGYPFVCNNKMRGGANIQIRLDRAMANADWRMMFPNAMVSHLSAGTFDHRPILLNTSPANQCLPKPFRFTEIWTRDSSSYDIIRKAWNEPIERSPHFQLVGKLRTTKKTLKIWSKNYFGKVKVKSRNFSCFGANPNIG